MRAMFVAGRGPLSPVKDMIGSQSTKALHFLQRAQLVRREPGVWSGGRLTAIETYPAPAVRRRGVRERVESVHEQVDAHASRWGPAARHDARDAATCAVVAWLFATQRDVLAAPPLEADPAEGWIWLPPVG